MKLYAVRFTHYDEGGEPRFGLLKKVCMTEVAAESAIKKNASHYCNLYNRSHDTKPFRWDADDSGEFDYIIHFNDGDNSRLVTGYDVVEIDVPERTPSKAASDVKVLTENGGSSPVNPSDKLWRIPCEWSVSAVAKVSASTLAGAIEKVRAPEFPLPADPYYLEDSFAVADVDEDYIRNVYNDDQPDAEEEGADDEC